MGGSWFLCDILYCLSLYTPPQKKPIVSPRGGLFTLTVASIDFSKSSKKHLRDPDLHQLLLQVKHIIIHHLKAREFAPSMALSFPEVIIIDSTKKSAIAATTSDCVKSVGSSRTSPIRLCRLPSRLALLQLNESFGAIPTRIKRYNFT